MPSPEELAAMAPPDAGSKKGHSTRAEAQAAETKALKALEALEKAVAPVSKPLPNKPISELISAEQSVHILSTINKMMVPGEPKLGQRLTLAKRNYTIIGEGGKGLGAHWKLRLDLNP